MNKRFPAIVFLIMACLGSLQAGAGQKLRVFFMGNSYTYFNDMPKMVADIAASMGDTLVYDSHTPGGYTFEDHWTGLDPCFINVKKASWDYFVMQEQSQRPAFGQYLAMPSHPTYTYAGQFIKLIRDSAKCTNVMFYMTWGYKDGDSNNCPWQQSMCTYQSMDSILRARYIELADSFDAVVSPAGAVRRYIRQNHPGIELYQADGSHPTVAGSYAVALSFYAALFKKDPSLTTFNGTLPAAEAANIKAAAKKVVYDSLAYWGLGVRDLSAVFDHGLPSTTSVSFTNKSSLKAQNFTWNFGDGTTSTAKDPVHVFPAYGSYTVTLTAYGANGCTRVTSKTVNVIPAGINDATLAPFTISPNPAKESITILSNQQASRFTIRIVNAMGQTVYQAPATSSGETRIDLSAFSNGMYYITLYNDTAVLHHDKFVKQ